MPLKCHPDLGEAFAPSLTFFNIPDFCACYHSMDARPPVGLLLCLVVSHGRQAPSRGPPYSPLPMPLSLLFMSSFPIVVVAVIVVAILVSAIVLHGRPATCFHFTLACRLSARSARPGATPLPATAAVVILYNFSLWFLNIIQRQCHCWSWIFSSSSCPSSCCSSSCCWWWFCIWICICICRCDCEWWGGGPSHAISRNPL